MKLSRNVYILQSLFVIPESIGIYFIEKFGQEALITVNEGQGSMWGYFFIKGITTLAYLCVISRSFSNLDKAYYQKE